MALITPSATALNKKGLRALKAKKWKAAGELFTRAIGKHPGYFEAYRNRACARVRSGLFEAALKDLEETMYLDFARSGAGAKCLARLRQPPHSLALDAITKKARKRYREEIGKAVLFLGSKKKLGIKRGNRGEPDGFTGDQSVYG